VILIIFALLSCLILRLSLRWRWRSVILAAVAIGFIADALLERWVMPR
jgi:hypothetical protein